MIQSLSIVIVEKDQVGDGVAIEFVSRERRLLHSITRRTGHCTSKGDSSGASGPNQTPQLGMGSARWHPQRSSDDELFDEDPERYYQPEDRHAKKRKVIVPPYERTAFVEEPVADDEPEKHHPTQEK